MIALYAVVLMILTIYSYALIDPNLSLMSNKYWVLFRDPMVQFGYYQRVQSWYVYLAIVIALYIFHFFFIKRYKKYNPLSIAFIIGAILVFSYPFLSHDLFNYVFDAKILTFYGQNPYLHKALDYPDDQWLRFMHWTHRSYPYGPFFLVLSLIPSYLAVGKFILNYFFFKSFFVGFYVLAVFSLAKIDKRSALEFATHPLIIIEGLVSTHNDLIAVSLALVGFYYLMQKQQLWGRALMILSVLIKYTTLPLPFVTFKQNNWMNWIVMIVQIALLVYLSLFREVQQWYFLTLFAYLPLYKSIINKSNIFLFGLLISYYPYIYIGGADTAEKLWWKHVIIFASVVTNILYILFDKVLLLRSQNVISTK